MLAFTSAEKEMNRETEHAACSLGEEEKNHMGVNLSSTECLSPVRFLGTIFVPGRLLRYASRYATPVLNSSTPTQPVTYSV